MAEPRPILMTVFTCLVYVLALVGYAQDEEHLYDPAPPPDAAFVRFVAGNAAVEHYAIGSASFDALDPGVATSYVVVEQGTRAYSLGEVEGTLEVEAGNFYTLALANDQVLVFEDAAVEDRARASLSFYNLTDAPLSLMTRDGETAVLPDVAAGEHAHVDVNPVDVAFAVFGADGAVADVEELRLARARAFAVFAFPADEEDGVAATHVAATTEAE